MGCNCGSSSRRAGVAQQSGRVIYRHYRPDGSYQDHLSQSKAEEQRKVAGGRVEPIQR